jgi:bifunctional oligoribonuclease and PAP phosphatase NrnA
LTVKRAGFKRKEVNGRGFGKSCERLWREFSLVMSFLKKIINKIKEYDKIICLRHIDADGDAYGSAMGLAQLIKDNFPSKKVFTDGKNNENLSFLGKNDQLIKEDYQNSLVIVCDTANQERIDSEY